jgi:hypothetical protein
MAAGWGGRDSLARLRRSARDWRTLLLPWLRAPPQPSIKRAQRTRCIPPIAWLRWRRSRSSTGVVGARGIGTWLRPRCASTGTTRSPSTFQAGTSRPVGRSTPTPFVEAIGERRGVVVVGHSLGGLRRRWCAFAFPSTSSSLWRRRSRRLGSASRTGGRTPARRPRAWRRAHAAERNPARGRHDRLQPGVGLDPGAELLVRVVRSALHLYARQSYAAVARARHAATAQVVAAGVIARGDVRHQLW